MGQLLALVDALRDTQLSEKQVETVRQLRVGLSALAEKESILEAVKARRAKG